MTPRNSPKPKKDTRQNNNHKKYKLSNYECDLNK